MDLAINSTYSVTMTWGVFGTTEANKAAVRGVKSASDKSGKAYNMKILQVASKLPKPVVKDDEGKDKDDKNEKDGQGKDDHDKHDHSHDFSIGGLSSGASIAIVVAIFFALAGGICAAVYCCSDNSSPPPS